MAYGDKQVWRATIEVMIQFPMDDGRWGSDTREVSAVGRTQRDAKEWLSDRLAKVCRNDRFGIVSWPNGAEVISIDLTHAPKMERCY